MFNVLGKKILVGRSSMEGESDTFSGLLITSHEITCSSSSSQVSVFIHCHCYYDYYYCLPKYYNCNCGRFSFVCYAVIFEILHFVGGRDMKGNVLVILQSDLHSIEIDCRATSNGICAIENLSGLEEA